MLLFFSVVFKRIYEVSKRGLERKDPLVLFFGKRFETPHPQSLSINHKCWRGKVSTLTWYPKQPFKNGWMEMVKQPTVSYVKNW